MHEQPTEPDSDAARAVTASARYVVTTELPEGEILVPVDSPHGTVMLVREGHMSPELAAAINSTLGWMTRCGVWNHR
ncbi:hypothetical protein RM844_28895 [Streptomyces sp. DSM 44915]|uniref:Uncharacterized protein n=1 Tax=Streptomyces chisholmiae TaxID=3075540 RepID=A0ABU2JZ71_9ACTN|nr:hypothetical protein [Streptomyces sp. DSM 44915]MDT0270296.1 hypothetical protein [Streptomyces sp. DSM 44915]